VRIAQTVVVPVYKLVQLVEVVPSTIWKMRLLLKVGDGAVCDAEKLTFPKLTQLLGEARQFCPSRKLTPTVESPRLVCPEGVSWTWTDKVSGHRQRCTPKNPARLVESRAVYDVPLALA
jgi:hypothetical protein